MSGLIKILIIESEARIAELAVKVLLQTGYDVVGIASDMAAALPLAQRRAPDLVITDLQLCPHRDGIAAASAVMRAGNAAILFAAPRSETAVMARLAATRPTGVLPKPYDSQDIFPALTIFRRCVHPYSQTELPLR